MSEDRVGELVNPRPATSSQFQLGEPITEALPTLPGEFRLGTQLGGRRALAETGIFAHAGIGLQQGTGGLAEVSGGALRALGSAIGSDSIVETGDDLRAFGQGIVEDAGRPLVSRLEDIENGTDALRFIMYGAGQAVPSLALSTGAALAAGALVPSAPIVAPLVAAGGIGFILGAGEVYLNLLDKGHDSPGAAALAGVPMGLLDAVTPYRIGKQILWRPARRAAAAVGTAFAEGFTEVGQETIGAITEGIVTGEPVLTPENASRLLNAFALGTIGGGVAGGVVALLPGETRPLDDPPPPDITNPPELTPEEEGPQTPDDRMRADLGRMRAAQDEEAAARSRVAAALAPEGAVPGGPEVQPEQPGVPPSPPAVPPLESEPAGSTPLGAAVEPPGGPAGLFPERRTAVEGEIEGERTVQSPAAPVVSAEEQAAAEDRAQVEAEKLRIWESHPEWHPGRSEPGGGVSQVGQSSLGTPLAPPEELPPTSLGQLTPSELAAATLPRPGAPRGPAAAPTEQDAIAQPASATAIRPPSVDQAMELQSLGYGFSQIAAMSEEQATTVLAEKGASGPTVRAVPEQKTPTRAERVRAPEVDLSNLPTLTPAPGDGDFVFADKLDVQARFETFQRLLFPGQLVGWKASAMPNLEKAFGRPGALGVRPSGMQLVGLNTRFGFTPAEFDAILLHEMVHGATEPGHGAAFRKEARRVEQATGLKGMASAVAEVGDRTGRSRPVLEGANLTVREVFNLRRQRAGRAAAPAVDLAKQTPSQLVEEAAQGLMLEGVTQRLQETVQRLRGKKLTRAKFLKAIRRPLLRAGLANEDVDLLLDERADDIEKLFDPKQHALYAGSSPFGQRIEEIVEEEAPPDAFIVIRDPSTGEAYQKNEDATAFIVEARNLDETMQGLAHVAIEQTLEGMDKKGRNALRKAFTGAIKDLPEGANFGEWMVGVGMQLPAFEKLAGRLHALHQRSGSPKSYSEWTARLGPRSKAESAPGRPSESPVENEIAVDEAEDAIRLLYGKDSGAPADNDGKALRVDLQQGLDKAGFLYRWFKTLLQRSEINAHIKELQQFTDEAEGMAKTTTVFNQRLAERLNEVANLPHRDQEFIYRYLFDVTAASDALHAQKQMRKLTPAEKQSIAARHKLGPEAVQTAERILGDLGEVLNTMEQLELAGIPKIFKDPAVAAARAAEVKQKYAALRNRDYFPYQRYGKYVVTVRAKETLTIGKETTRKGALVSWETFESERAQKQGRKDAERRFGGPKTAIGTSILTDTQVSLIGFSPTALRALTGQLDLTPDQTRQLEELQFRFSGGAGYRQSLQKRTGTAGYSKEGQRVFTNYMIQAGHHVARLTHHTRMQELINQVGSHIRIISDQDGDANNRSRIHEDMSKWFKHIMDPSNDWPTLRGAIFKFYFWGNARSALVNLTQVPVASWGYLGARYGTVASSKELSRAWSLAWRGMIPDKKTGSLFNKKVYTAEESAAIEWAGDSITQGLSSELAGISGQRGVARMLPGGVGSKLLQAVLDGGTAPFKYAEIHNRLSTFVAAYNLLKKSGVPEAQARLDAKRAVDDTQGQHALWNRPPVLRGKAGTVLMFRSFTLNQLHLMFNDKGKLRMWGVMLGMAGLLGLPGAEDIADAIDFIVGKVTGGYSDVRQEAREMIEEIVPFPELVMHGASRYSLGASALQHLFGIPIPAMDLSGSLSMGRLIPGVDPLLGQQGQFNTRLARGITEVGGPAASVGVSFMRALASDDPNQFRRWLSTMPPAIKNAGTAIRDAEQGAYTDNKGNVLARIDPFDTLHQAELIGKALSFRPQREASIREGRWAAKSAGQYWLMRKGIWANGWAHAVMTGDQAGRADMLKSMRQFNRDAPRGFGISSQDMKRAVETRLRGRALAARGLPASKQMIPLYRDYYTSEE